MAIFDKLASAKGAKLPAGAKAVTKGEFALFQQALKATHSNRWNNHSMYKISSKEPAYQDM